jgi:hypothetical protein
MDGVMPCFPLNRVWPRQIGTAAAPVCPRLLALRPRRPQCSTPQPGPRQLPSELSRPRLAPTENV